MNAKPRSIHSMTTQELRHMLLIDMDEDDAEDGRLIQAIRAEIEDRRIHGRSLVSCQPFTA
jgi:hypothetical protein